MTVGDILKPLPDFSFISWQEEVIDCNGDKFSEDEEMCFDKMLLKDFLKDNPYSYRTRDLELKDRSGEYFEINIVPYFDRLDISIKRQFYDE